MGARGIAFGSPQLDLQRLRAWKSSVVAKLTGGLKVLVKQRKVDVVRGTGRFVSQNVLEVMGASGSQRIHFDQCIIAAGSEPARLAGLPGDPRILDSTDALELPSLAGVKVSERGFIPVDRQMRTNVPHIFAIGDIAAPPLLAHKAMHEGKVAAEVAAGHKRAFDVRVIPSVAYTDPEIAWVGLTETDAPANGTAFRKGAFPWVANGRSLSLGRDEGFTKLLFDPDSHRAPAGGVVGTNAGELISEIAL